MFSELDCLQKRRLHSRDSESTSNPCEIHTLENDKNHAQEPGILHDFYNLISESLSKSVKAIVIVAIIAARSPKLLLETIIEIKIRDIPGKKR